MYDLAMRPLSKHICFFFLPFVLISCGGGGGGGSASAPTIPLVSINFSVSDAAIDVDDSTTLTWSTSNASSCSASGSWSGSKALSGSESIQISSSGTKNFTLTCQNSEGTSSSRSVSVFAGYQVTDISISHPSGVSGIQMYVDINSNSRNDSGEPIFTSDSDGKIEIRHEDLDTSICYQKFPIISADSETFLYSPSTNFRGPDDGVNPLTTIFSDTNNRYGSVIFDTSENDQSCTDVINLFFNNWVTSWIERIILRLETFYGYTYQDLMSSNAISSQKFSDLVKFQNSIESIEDTLYNQLSEAASQTGLSYNLYSTSELDDSTFSIFLNNATYPNPSTDTSPVAISIDDVAVQAGLFVRLKAEDYFGSNTWDNFGIFEIDDLMISNNGEILLDEESCHINFSNLCKLESTLTNIISYGSVDLFDAYTKNTSRGLEAFSREDLIVQKDTGLCRVWEDRSISSKTQQQFVKIAYSEYRGEGTWDTEFVGCPTFDDNYSGLTITDLRDTGESYYTELWDNYGSSFNFPSAYVGDFDTDYPPPEQIETEIVLALAKFESFYNNTANRPELSSEPSPFNILLDLLIYAYDAYEEYESILYYLDFYTNSQDRNGRVKVMWVSFDTLTFTCSTPDLNINDLDVYSNFGLLLDCIDQFSPTYNFINEAPVSNKSPYRGIVND